MPNRNRNRIFVSYSHKDKEWLDRLREVLAPDIRNDRIDYWDDRELQPGEPWLDRILDSIARARVAVLLVSPNFLNSSFIMEEELPRILKAVDDGITVIWIPLFGTFYGPDTPPALKPLTDLQAAVSTSIPLAELDSESLKETLLDLCKRINKLLNPGRVPRNLPFNSLSNLFKGRDEDLAKLDAHLREDGAAAIVQPETITGIGGIGKTRLAIEYAWRHTDDFTAFLFVYANRPDDLDRNFARLSAPDALDLPEYKFGKQDDQHAAVLRWLQQNKGWLLILDNVDTPEAVAAVQKLVAQLSGGHVLVTSRITQWGRGIQRLSLGVIPLNGAVTLLLEATQGQRLARSDDAERARRLAERLGCLPLALTHAVAYLSYYGIGFDDYLAEFEHNIATVLAYHDHTAIEYETETDRTETEPRGNARIKTVATTFFMSFHRLRSMEKALLRAASFLSPEPIPVAMFESCPEETKALLTFWCEESGEQASEKPMRDALAELARFSLITREDGTFSVHRMEQAILRSRVPNDSIPKWVEHTRAILYKYAPSETAESPRTWPIWDGIRPHAETLVALSIVDRRVKPHLDLMASLANLYFGKGLYSLSLTLEENLLNIAKRTHGEESTPVANRLLAYGESLRVLERNEDAERAFQRSLLIREKIDGPNSPRVGVVLNYLALAYATLGKNKEAESSYRRAIKICEDQGAKVNKEDFSKALNNLAVLLSEQEADDEAEQLLTKAVKLASDDTKKQFKPQTAIICITQLASLHVKKGNTSAAETLFRQALDRVSVFPTGHPFHEEVIERFAKFLRDTHRLTEARRLFSLLATTERARWGTDDSKKLPERRIRKKLRICEACFDVTWGSSIDSQDLGAQSDLLAEMSASEWKPWHPLNIQGIQVLDTKNLQFHFTFLTATDAEGSMTKQRQFRLLMDYFLSAIAVSEDDQWASADGRMAAELRGTALGFELLEQSKRLYRFIAAAVHTGTPSGDAFRKDLERQFGQPHATWPSVVLEVWIAPSKQSVYTGEKLTGILSRFAGSEKAGAEARAFVIKASLCPHWECQLKNHHMHSEEKGKAFVSCFDAAFKSHVVPMVQRSITEGRFLSSLRRIHHAMVLATWFKMHYRWHPKVATYLETGNPAQLLVKITSED